MSQLVRPASNHVALAVKEALDKVFGWTGPWLLENRCRLAIKLAGAIEVNSYLWGLSLISGLRQELISALLEAKDIIVYLEGDSNDVVLITELAVKIIKGRQKQKQLDGQL